MSRLERLMGNNVVVLTDRKYMLDLQRKIQQDCADKTKDRIKLRERNELEREKKLILAGKIPLEEAPCELVAHPAFRITRMANGLIEEVNQTARCPLSHAPVRSTPDLRSCVMESYYQRHRARRPSVAAPPHRGRRGRRFSLSWDDFDQSEVTSLTGVTGDDYTRDLNEVKMIIDEKQHDSVDSEDELHCSALFHIGSDGEDDICSQADWSRTASKDAKTAKATRGEKHEGKSRGEREDGGRRNKGRSRSSSANCKGRPKSRESETATERCKAIAKAQKPRTSVLENVRNVKSLDGKSLEEKEKRFKKDQRNEEGKKDGDQSGESEAKDQSSGTESTPESRANSVGGKPKYQPDERSARGKHKSQSGESGIAKNKPRSKDGSVKNKFCSAERVSGERRSRSRETGTHGSRDNKGKQKRKSRRKTEEGVKSEMSEEKSEGYGTWSPERQGKEMDGSPGRTLSDEEERRHEKEDERERHERRKERLLKRDRRTRDREMRRRDKEKEILSRFNEEQRKKKEQDETDAGYLVQDDDYHNLHYETHHVKAMWMLDNIEDLYEMADMVVRDIVAHRPGEARSPSPQSSIANMIAGRETIDPVGLQDDYRPSPLTPPGAGFPRSEERIVQSPKSAPSVQSTKSPAKTPKTPSAISSKKERQTSPLSSAKGKSDASMPEPTPTVSKTASASSPSRATSKRNSAASEKRLARFRSRFHWSGKTDADK